MSTLLDEPRRSLRPEALSRWSLASAVWALAAATTVGTLLELAVARHWNGWIQLIPWVAGTVLLVALAAARYAPPRWRPAARAALALVLLVGVIGVVEHVRANWLAAPLDSGVGPTWDQRGLLSQLWLAASGGVGPSPSFAPLVITQAAVLGLLVSRPSD